MKFSPSFGKRCSFDEKLMLPITKLSVEITRDDTPESILKYLRADVFTFGLDLFYNTIEENLRIVEMIRDTVQKESEDLGYSIPLAIYLKLSPRFPCVGKFYKNKAIINLKRNDTVILTSDREYASKSCHRKIYVNAKFQMTDLKECDILCVGRYVQLQVMDCEEQCDQVECKVIMAGEIKPRTEVRFPKEIQNNYVNISAEELQDITFAIGTNIDVIMTHTPQKCEKLREILQELRCSHFYLLTQITPNCIANFEAAKKISDSYDGFLIDTCSSTTPCEQQVLKFSPEIRALMDHSYKRGKPIFLKGFDMSCVDPLHYRYAFFLPDKFEVTNLYDTRFVRLYEALFQRLSKLYFFDKKTPNPKTSFARSVADSSFDYQADAIVVSSNDPKDAAEISHFRPNSVIVTVENSNNFMNHDNLFHNICSLSFDCGVDLQYFQETYAKLIQGTKYALAKNIVDCLSNVLLVFRKHKYSESLDKFAVIKIDDDYETTIRNVSLI